MALPWSLGFHVAIDSDFETRYQTVLASHPVPAAMTADAAKAHDLAVEIIANHGIVVPMDVTLNGWWDSDNVRASVTAQVNQA